MKSVFLSLVRLGIGTDIDFPFKERIDWSRIKALADQQGLSAIVLDGIEELRKRNVAVSLPEKKVLTQWIGEVLQNESINAIQQKSAGELALLFHYNHIRTYILKGVVIAECYPRPEHRFSTDVDCYLLPDKGEFDAWTLGNDLVKTRGFEVETVFYKNSTFFIPGMTVENHQFLTPFRGNKRLEYFEILLQSMLKNDLSPDSAAADRKFDGVWLYRPPVMVTALFIIEHAYSHFLHEGLTWRHVLDWKMFSLNHIKEIDWDTLDALIDEFGFRKFYDTYYKLGGYLIGSITEDELTRKDRRMLEDLWDNLDLHDSVRGFRGKMALVGNTWRARWKYHNFSEISMLHALWIQVKGFLFIKNPSLG